jgi:hypothetical protein
MRKASEYRQNARECRQLAAGMPPGEKRDQLLQMAATWEQLAEERSHRAARYPELAEAEEAEPQARTAAE